MAKAQQLKLRLFMEGVEVPIISIQLQGLPNAPLMAAIQIPPLAEGTRLLPRTLIHVFFLDFYEEESPFLSQATTEAKDGSKEREPTGYQQGLENPTSRVADLVSTQKNQQYKVLFVGELLGFEWSKMAGNRSLVLQCSDLSNYWDYAYQWSNTDLFGPGIKALFSGGSTNLFTDFLSSKGEVLTNILRTPSLTFPQLKGLAGGIIHLLEAIGGSYHTEKKIAGQNIFFTTAELRLHIMQMIMAIEDDPTASRMVGNAAYGGLFNRLLGGLGGQTSIRDALKALSAVIFHETYAQPCPLYISGLEGTVEGVARKKVAEDYRTAFLAFGSRLVIRNLEEIKTQINIAEEKPEVQLKELQSRESLKVLRTPIDQRLSRMKKFLSGLQMQLRKVTVAGAAGLLTGASQKIGQARTKLSKWRPDNKLTQELIKDIDDTIDTLRRLENLTVVTTARKNARPARLVQQILRPDVWFSSPPRCNAIFPEHYDSLAYRRSFMEEPTRLLLKTNDEFFGEDALFDKMYFAPKARSLKKTRTDLQALLRNDLLEHEILTGILPVFEKMGELNIFAYRGGATDKKMQKVGLAQRSANFIYFKYRFAARQMTVSGRFNPYIAMGFPGVIIDKYVDVDTLALHNELLKKVGRPTRDINKLLGTNFLGNFTQVTHSVAQDNGRTDIVLSYPRQPEEGVEFLGASDLEDVKISKQFDEDVTRTTDVAAIAPPKIGSSGPNSGRVVRVENVTALYAGPTTEQFDDPIGGKHTLAKVDPSPSTKSLVIFWPSRNTFNQNEAAGDKERASKKLPNIEASVPIGVSIPKDSLSKEVRLALGLGDNVEGNVTLIALRITEEVPRFKQQAVDLPAEEYIRPGWYGDIWHPAMISKAYQQFFRTGSITEASFISDPAGGSFNATNNFQAEATERKNTGVYGAEDPRGDAIAMFALEAGASIEQAVAFLQATYSHIKQNGLDIEEFIRAYTWRPIATLVDMFGTTDLQLSPDGQFVLQGVEGFHSRAFGPFNNLFGLVTQEIDEVVGLKRGTTSATRGDTRKIKQDRVKDYVSALGFARAILG